MKAMRYSDGKIVFYCEGCEEHHGIDPNRWAFNGDFERPTFSPSILVRGTKFTEKGEVEYEAWQASGYPKRNEPFDSVPTVCHSFVSNGLIQFLNDCTHSLAGKTIDLPDVED